MAARAGQDVQGQVSTLRDAWAGRYGCRMEEDNQALPWMIRHAGNLISRCMKGLDGKTAHQRIK